MPTIFKDRQEAGQQLAEKLTSYQGKPAIVLGMPRGGVVVAAEVAKRLHLPLDVIVSRKIGAPDQPEYAIGAISCNGISVFNEAVVHQYGLTPDDLQIMISHEQKELERRMILYTQKTDPPNVTDRIVILVDDGIATGLTALATLRALKSLKPQKIILASGVCALDSVKPLQKEADEVVCIMTPAHFYAVGSWYEHFDQTTDEEVITLLEQSKNRRGE